MRELDRKVVVGVVAAPSRFRQWSERSAAKVTPLNLRKCRTEEVPVLCGPTWTNNLFRATGIVLRRSP